MLQATFIPTQHSTFPPPSNIPYFCCQLSVLLEGWMELTLACIAGISYPRLHYAPAVWTHPLGPLSSPDDVWMARLHENQATLLCSPNYPGQCFAGLDLMAFFKDSSVMIRRSLKCLCCLKSPSSKIPSPSWERHWHSLALYLTGKKPSLFEKEQNP